MRDFADFIRSTGPESLSTYTVKPARSARSDSAQKERPGSSILQAGPKKLTKAPSATSPKQGYTSAPSKSEVAPKRTASKLQAREATVRNNNTTADLADFLRSGPDGMDGPHGVPRSGAHIQPITTSNIHVNGRQAVGSGTSVASTQDSFAPSKMTQSSTNSRTGLLDTANRAYPPSPSAGRNNGAPSPRSIENPQARPPKQRRIKDPYHLESDDENDDTSLATEHEESLSDFLRNYTPPPAAASRPLPVGIIGAPKPAKQSVTLKERIQRNIAVIPDYRPLPPKAPRKPPSSKSPPQSNESRRKSQRENSTNSGSSPLSSASRPSINGTVSSSNNHSQAPQLPPISARVMSPHLVSQNGSTVNSYKPTQPTYAKNVERRPKQQLQARDERGALSGSAQSGGMADLADFLRETEPPPPSGPVLGGMRSMSPLKEKEESSSFGRMFSRRKKDLR